HCAMNADFRVFVAPRTAPNTRARSTDTHERRIWEIIVSTRLSARSRESRFGTTFVAQREAPHPPVRVDTNHRFRPLAADFFRERQNERLTAPFYCLLTIRVVRSRGRG